MITYEQILKANDGLAGVDVKGKNYIMVTEKVKGFRKLFPDGFIQTSLLSLEGGVCVMQAKAGYYLEDGKEIVLGTGTAFENQGSSFINKTSYIENCETSAVGRALSFMGIGADDSIASAEELANAINNQGEEKQNTRVQGFMKANTKLMMQAFGISNEEEMKQKIIQWKRELTEEGKIPNVQFAKMDIDQAEELIDAIYTNYKPSGAKK